MKYTYFVASLLLLSTATFANSAEKNHTARVVQLLNQPLTKQVYCARGGYLGYQHALTGVYLSGIHGVKKNPIKAYTWALIANYQIEKTGDQKLIARQKNTLRIVETQMAMTAKQKRYAHWQANYIIHHHHRKWPTATTLLTMKSYPVPCTIA